MKKIISLILFATMLVSCGSDYDLKGNHEEPEAKLYEISFAIESKSFEVEVEPLSSASYGTARDGSIGAICQIIIYDKVGAVVLNDLYTLTEVLNETINGVFSPKISLAKGEYHVVAMSRREAGVLGSLVIFPEKFETDYFGGFKNDLNPVYYAVVPYTVSEAHNDVAHLVLQPMFSEVTLKIKDHKTFSVPKEAVNIRVYISKSAGFYVKTLEPRVSTEMLYATQRIIEDVRKLPELKIRFDASAVADNIAIEIRFTKLNEETKEYDEVIDARTIASFKLENGKRYTVSGNLGDDYYPSDPAFGITWGSIGGEDLEIPFGE